MARAAVSRRLTWRLARVVELTEETPTVRSIGLAVADWPGHLPGQHVDVRLTAPDGYQAQRSYSIASPPTEDGRLALTVERLPDGEVSSYLAGELRTDDQLELRGPIGGYFVWEPRMGGPLLLVAGGSGIVPLMAMLRHRAKAKSTVPARLLYSSRSLPDLIYREELDRLAAQGDGLEVRYTLTRDHPADWPGLTRRIDPAMLSEVAWPETQGRLAYVCGPTPLVESVARGLLELGYPADRIRTERFGPTGGSS
jgi:ferredoxin-NADP reductase